MPDRQSARAICRSSSMRVFALVVAAFAIGRSEAARAGDLSIDAEPSALIAPAAVTLSAKSISEDPIVSYHWTGLPNAPRCREERCAITVPIASCTSVQLAAVTLLGETLTATRALCAADLGGGRAPQLDLEIEGNKISAKISGGSSPIAVMRGFVDGVELEGDPLEAVVEAEDGCHAIDFFVADRAGRVATAQHLFCLDDDAPQLWIGGRPSSWVPVGERMQRCAEAAHPLGLPVTLTGGEVALNGCASESEPPRAIEHAFISGSDPRGIESFASAFFAATPKSGPPVLFFAEGPTRLNAAQDQNLSFTVDIFGGVGPFDIRGAAASASERVPGRITVEIADINQSPGERPFPLTIFDSRGLAASIAPILRVSSPSGPMSMDPMPSALDGARACVCTAPGDRAALWPLLFAVLFIARTRKR